MLYGDSIRFKNRVVDTGMSKGKVFLIAGQPDWKASYIIGDRGYMDQPAYQVNAFSNTSLVTGFSGNFDPLGSVAVEEWLFNRGKYRLMKLLRFEDERLVAIVSVGYGFDDKRKGSIINPDWSALKVGDTSYEVLNRFGEPSLTESKPEISFVRIYGPHRHPLHYRSADVSWWYYNSGKNRLFRIIKLVNGRVVEIETEGYGL
ncbi:MAG: DUF2845 domain-containing protein [Verrucomicrobia bacterium]|nr:DUF2845 domain-containing protein [Verrucomicrobiota bacterium]